MVIVSLLVKTFSSQGSSDFNFSKLVINSGTVVVEITVSNSTERVGSIYESESLSCCRFGTNADIGGIGAATGNPKVPEYPPENAPDKASIKLKSI